MTLTSPHSRQCVVVYFVPPVERSCEPSWTWEISRADGLCAAEGHGYETLPHALEDGRRALQMMEQ